jgi:cellulose synthase/poly-beta-1,6-N-acetylglucosamine synthase-like glycosyltransferase
MQTALFYTALVCALAPAILVLIFFFEVAAALLLPNKRSRAEATSPSLLHVAVIVPAHNESTGMLPTIADIRAQLDSSDRLLVVADNCTDDTAAVARSAGAEVAERNDPAQRGKGFALDFGLQTLAVRPPEIVVFIDADCRVAPGTIANLASASRASGRPVQALNLCYSPPNSEVNHQIAEFAMRVKNWIRPQGLAKLCLPCQLGGTGMAFPWSVLKSAELASGQIVEDLKLGLDLARVGKPPVFCEAALVTSEFPSTMAAANVQRSRWEHGHVDMIFSQAPRYLAAALTQRNLGLLALVLDMAVPPLVLLGFLIVAAWLLAVAAFVLGVSIAPLAVSSATGLVFATALAMAWHKCGRDVLPPSFLLSIAPYVIGKLRLHRRLPLGGGNSGWIRTDRKK